MGRLIEAREIHRGRTKLRKALDQWLTYIEAEKPNH